ncbi:hypothetical protein FIA58_007390 [Flavobacterium jejuense]|uniref:DUF4878 domain-containing protein n=1 Tax=Flavobacterium jejuense TaxID=1544455 RepID=A0ABX0IRL7_9FLAO|nr:hypothetical protein [Flavobacterium jejuense]NHN25497.1 hypothetical protein [Flavobacterium jejuense]
MIRICILVVFLILSSCNLNNKKKYQEAEKIIERYYKTYNFYSDISEFDVLLTDDFKSRYKQDFIKNTQMFKDSFGPVINYKNERMTLLSEGLSTQNIRVVYDVEYKKFYNKEVFDLTKDSVDNRFKINAYKLDTYKLKD